MSTAGWFYLTIIVLIAVGAITTMTINSQGIALEQLKLCQQAGGRWVPYQDNWRINQPDIKEHCDYAPLPLAPAR